MPEKRNEVKCGKNTERLLILKFIANLVAQFIAVRTGKKIIIILK